MKHVFGLNSNLMVYEEHAIHRRIVDNRRKQNISWMGQEWVTFNENKLFFHSFVKNLRQVYGAVRHLMDIRL